MNGMFDQSDKEYLDLKFGNIISEVKKISAKNTTDILEISKTVDSLVTFKDNHIEHHKVSKNDRKWGYEMKVVIAIFAIGQLISIIDRFLPTP